MKAAGRPCGVLHAERAGRTVGVASWDEAGRENGAALSGGTRHKGGAGSSDEVRRCGDVRPGEAVWQSVGMVSDEAPEQCGCRNPAHADFQVAAGLFMRGPAADLIHCFKYCGASKLAPFLAGRALRAEPALCPSPPDFYVPVPLHPSRVRERGYNQSRLLADELTRLTGILTAADLLVRARPTRPQVGLAPEGRAANVEGAFVAPFPSALSGRTVTVVDDVATTGATLRACAGALLDAGATRVAALVAALS